MTKSSKMRFMTLALGSLLAASPVLGASPIVVAGTVDPDLIVRRVSFADLDLVSSAGEVRLNRRVGQAVNGLCDTATGRTDGSLRTLLPNSACRQSAWDNARPQIATAVQRAREIAATGSSRLAARAISVFAAF